MRAAEWKSIEHGIHAGRDLELSLFGEANISDPNYKRALADKIQIREGGRYVDFKDSVELAKRFQSSDPTNPNKDFLRELRLAIVDQLNLAPDTSDSVKVYTAVNTPLDKFHGVDGFATYQSSGGEILITMDVTANPEKVMRGAKAQVIIGEVADPRENEEEYLREIDKYAGEIIERIHDELERRNRMRKAPPRFEEEAQFS
ncbi:hypothetical protein A3B21_03890 [Candidatus Uhrbacteria bacterium RIFCSPLOWO2_01_FULL_47_24]|uniref:Uncharacterized protein n=1 Tax=Candidatus Uhrbacteria bacterium RIFCSPLOWO2_01_FULL_47_24 TaxID=1802401 RepID=A0A1F7UUR6_9BACT|nr:MAG: hypothetical protein A2753_00635 [Candidatus Uhrbacteria bacterium RIFCSPHIGHO2_01_FULL_47_11]OGL69113.1 MAG: hypothetical protein A3D58_02590 [Candidatus Uhrbacteria bacterium RIFCSPHIGHO2_02_FULL_46_47]OGL75724.1 MAG: hypothetical protein A3F52_02315 [Candidatus Uhrbacteria bacterium RIFCSPHIGHO2_12_FULL_47_11]OGL81484.1 MAG: hypothetical protein A3B21_03890 [Candidatus Uhrbacteria bacterium RIFCSPLOWO2_01_FULL_47_24]OGL83729.1 MAG: hypothetical protein A3J03_01345 [Candidatus Uhrbact